ncbi:MAG TPA: site-specific integrase [Sphingopyxis sp.]|nr:site-specific integrase [Sphingopyxis sp.]
MKIRLKGLNRVRRKLADGSVTTYYYAWKGGPRLSGSPGSAEFIADYNAAVAEAAADRRDRHRKDWLRTVIDDYLNSAEYRALADRTRKDYAVHARHIDQEFGDMPIKLLQDRRARGEFLAWRDRMAVKSRRNADYRFAILARIISWGFNRGLVPCNPCERPGKLYRSNRKDKIWQAEDEAAFYDKAPAHLHLALTLALWTGQRQGDLLALTWRDYDGKYIRLTQQKTGARVIIPVGQPLRTALDACRAGQVAERARHILQTVHGQPWTSDGFRTSWRKACDRASITGLTFHDLRGTAVTRLAIAGCSEAEIVTITGHSMKDVGSILDASYLHRDSQLAQSAIEKLERSLKAPN